MSAPSIARRRSRNSWLLTILMAIICLAFLAPILIVLMNSFKGKLFISTAGCHQQAFHHIGTIAASVQRRRRCDQTAYSGIAQQLAVTGCNSIGNNSLACQLIRHKPPDKMKITGNNIVL